MTAVLAADVVTERTAIGLYLVYVVVAISLVAFLAQVLRRSGAVVLTDVFNDAKLADSVNRLLVIGFYLFNLGYAFLLYQLQPAYTSFTDAFNELIVNIGWLLLSLGLIHLVNMFVLWRIRTHRDSNEALRRALRSKRFIPPQPLSAPPPERPDPTLR